MNTYFWENGPNRLVCHSYHRPSICKKCNSSKFETKNKYRTVTLYDTNLNHLSQCSMWPLDAIKINANKHEICKTVARVTKYSVLPQTCILNECPLKYQ